MTLPIADSLISGALPRSTATSTINQADLFNSGAAGSWDSTIPSQAEVEIPMQFERRVLFRLIRREPIRLLLDLMTEVACASMDPM